MSFDNLALKCGVESSDLQDLMYGHVREGIQGKGKAIFDPKGSIFVDRELKIFNNHGFKYDNISARK